jgi:hypothetical protein
MRAHSVYVMTITYTRLSQFFHNSSQRHAICCRFETVVLQEQTAPVGVRDSTIVVEIKASVLD